MPRFTTSDGLRIVYRTWAVDPTLPPVFLHHGFIADAQLNWVIPGIVEALAEAGRSIVAHDARGHGRSSTPHDPALYGEARMAADVRELADHLGIGDFDLVGYSMGGVVAILTAVQEPRVRRLVVGGVGASIVEQGGADAQVMDRTALAEVLERDEPGEVTDPTIAAFRGYVDAVGGDRLALAAQARAVHHAPIALERITAPTLLLVGADDPLAARPHVLVDAIAGAQLEIVAGDHMGALAAERFVPAMIEHLAG